MKLIFKSNRCSLLFVTLLLLLSGCSSLGTNSKTSISQNIHSLKLSNPVSQQRVIIYSHGIHRPQQTEPCYMPYNKPPKSLMEIVDKQTMVYRLCSTATEAPAISSAGRQVYLRKIEINHAIDAFIARGVKPRHLFLAGHSNGGWTSLMMMRDVNKRFNGVIAYAPAFAGKRSEVSFAPWWRNTVRPKQIKDMLKAPNMDALVFAYERDNYNRPEDLEFLPANYPLVGSSGVDLVAYDCGLRNSHQTFRNDCRVTNTSQRIEHFINSQIQAWQ